MPQMDKAKRDNNAKQLAKAQALLAKFQEKKTKIEEGGVEPEEQVEYDMIMNAIGHFLSKVDRFSPAEPEKPPEPTPQTAAPGRYRS